MHSLNLDKAKMPTLLRDCKDHFKFLTYSASVIDHFTVVSSVAWPLNGSEAGGDLALIQTSLHLSCKCT